MVAFLAVIGKVILIPFFSGKKYPQSQLNALEDQFENQSS